MAITSPPPADIALMLYNTKARKKEAVVPLCDNKVRMYTCGPTVYHYAHIGNYRTYVFEDILRRAILFFGMEIEHVMNITDVDDKTIKGAIENAVSLDEYTQPYKDAFFEDLKTLSIQPAEHYPAATEYIAAMISFIEKLIVKGHAYKGADGSIYFSISSFPSYGSLSHLNLDELQTGASQRVESDEYDKEHAADFVLWKAYNASRDGNIFWGSPFGPGRPGWHLECSTMAMNILGDTIDIHAGGVDNIFPHHENEIAQSEALSGESFSKMWVHSEHLIVDNKKMSKSLGNFYTLRDVIYRGYTGAEVRYMLMQAHYKTQLNFTFEGLEAARSSMQRLHDFIHRLHNVPAEYNAAEGLEGLLSSAMRSFAEALADDLNISSALAALFNLVHDVNILYDKKTFNENDAARVLQLLKAFNNVLDVMECEEKEVAVPDDVLRAVEQREQARKDKNWARADELRDYTSTQGFTIEDCPSGPIVKKG